MKPLKIFSRFINNSIKFFLSWRVMRTVCSLLLVCFLYPTLHAQSAGTSEQSAVEILSIVNRQINGWNEGNIEAFMDGYRRSDSLRFASGGEVTYGWQTMLRRYRNNYPTKELMGTLSFSDVSVDVIADDAAVVFGRWKLVRSQDSPEGLFTLLFKKESETWRIVHDHTSSGN